MKIIVDAMGSDSGEGAVVEGILNSIDKIKSNIVVFGNKENILNEIKRQCNNNLIEDVLNRIEIINTTEVISNEEEPAFAIKKKKDSSIVRACEYLKKEDDAALVSAGSTGALMAGALLIVGRIKGISRPALSPMLPTYNSKGVLLLDAGAHLNATKEQLIQYAEMGNIYMQKVAKIDKPKLALLNVGKEYKKGTPLLQEVYQELSKNGNINFYGNIEGRDIFSGEADIVLCDAFVGNITLKVTEGVGSMIKKILKEEISKKWYYKIFALLLKPVFSKFAKRLDYTEYGGAILLGIKKPVIKCHGSSNGKSFTNTIIQAESILKNRVNDIIIQSIPNNI